jgi:hypothetical protein
MKKLGKLSISPEKIMKNEDLINLQGGYGDHWVYCKDWSGTVICPTIAFHTCGSDEIWQICRDLCPESTVVTCA